MTVLVGAVLAAGVLLCLSPWMWPLSDEAEPLPRQGRLVHLIEEAGFDGLSRRVFLTVIIAAGLVAASPPQWRAFAQRNAELAALLRLPIP